MMQARVSAIVINYNGGHDLIRCLESLGEQSLPPEEIIVVDNSSHDGSLDRALADFPNVTAIANKTNQGFAGGANTGAAAATGDLLLFLNPDVVLHAECLALLAEGLLKAPGVAGPAVQLQARVGKEYGGTIDRLGYPAGLRSPGNPLYVPGSALATSRCTFQDLGGFDERYFMFVEDLDYCWRVLLAGGDVTVPANAEAFHRGGGSTPGGYVRGRHLETTSFRLILRERNTFATLLKCASPLWLVWVIPAYLLKALLVSIWALLAGRPRAAAGILTSIAWNVRHLGTTIRLRRTIPRDRGSRQRVRERVHPRLLLVDRLLEFGFPRFVD
jgi:GT2 family glycosyltransferase